MSYFIAFLIAAALPLAALVGLNTRVGPNWGDLTRLGRLSTHDFGRNAPPGAPPLQMHRVDENAARVVVVGDSFSASNQWQSQWMTWRGRKDVISYHWDLVGDSSCLTALIRDLRSRLPEARHVVLEMVERSFEDRLVALGRPCGTPMEKAAPIQTADAIWADERIGSYWMLPDPEHVLRAWAAQYKSFKRQSRRDQVVVTPLNRSDLFTSRRANLLLRYTGDSAKVSWQRPRLQAGAQRLKAVQEELAGLGITMTVVVVPDKATFYAPYVLHPEDRVLAAVDPWALLDANGVPQVRLLDALRQGALSHRDIYLPDDTHFSMDGFRMMAAAVRNAVDGGPSVAIPAAPSRVPHGSP